ncbi:MAG: sugar transferase [Oscillospiraceae bacterium]|nr:sugar transferase [Oscillospiraceae bacterium]
MLKRIGNVNKGNIIKLLVIIVDIFLINVSYVAAFYIRFAPEVRLTGRLPMFNFGPYLAAIPFITISSLVYIDIFGLLKLHRVSLSSVVASIFKLVFMLALTTTTVTYFLSQFSFPRLVLLIAPVIQAAILIAWNFATLSLRFAGSQTSAAMIIGNAIQAQELSEKLSQVHIAKKMEVKYTFKPDEGDKCLRYIKKIDEVLICSDVSEELKMEILLVCMNRRKAAYLVPEVFELSLLSTRIVNFDDLPLLLMDSFNLTFEQRFFKRSFDLALSLISMPVILPVFAVIAALVKMSSPGRVLHRQERVTAGGRVFKILKFRTMYEDAESETGPVLSHEGDERVTAIGSFMRRYRIDELPQLLNVIKGDMSLVGPRSERPYFVEQYVKSIEGYEIRNTVRAGITGYAQIFGHYGTSAEHKLKYDLLYIKNYSLLLDIKLILQTFSAIVRKGSSLHSGSAGGIT